MVHELREAITPKKTNDTLYFNFFMINKI